MKLKFKYLNLVVLFRCTCKRGKHNFGRFSKWFLLWLAETKCYNYTSCWNNLAKGEIEKSLEWICQQGNQNNPRKFEAQNLKHWYLYYILYLYFKIKFLCFLASFNVTIQGLPIETRRQYISTTQIGVVWAKIKYRKSGAMLFFKLSANRYGFWMSYRHFFNFAVSDLDN